MGSVFERKRNVVFIAIFYTFLWGTAFPLVKLCMEGFGIGDADNMSKCLVAGIRFTISGLSLVVYNFITDKEGVLPAKTDVPMLVLYGVLGTSVQYSVTYIGLSNIDASKGAIFDQLGVFIIIILGGLLLKNDRLTLKKVIGCVVGLLGILAVNTEKMNFMFSFMGDGMMTLAALCQTGAYFVAILSANRVQTVKLVGFGQLFGGILLVVFALVMGGRIPTITVMALITLLALAGISAIAYVFSLIPLKYFPASEISVFNLLITVFGVIMSALVLDENIFKLNYLISIILIGIGIILVNKRKMKDDVEHI